MRFYSIVRLTLAVAVGLILGALLFRSRPAQAQNQMVVIVQATPPDHPINQIMAGSQVVGFSCVPGVAGDSPLAPSVRGMQPPAPQCFLATLAVASGK
jgi:hypothetical protein